MKLDYKAETPSHFDPARLHRTDLTPQPFIKALTVVFHVHFHPFASHLT